MKQSKIWGTTECLESNPLCELHRIAVLPGYRCSNHRHAHKWNLFYVERGELHVIIEQADHNDEIKVWAGMVCRVGPGLFHRFENRSSQVVEAFELYFPETLSEDIERLDVGQKIVEE